MEIIGKQRGRKTKTHTQTQSPGCGWLIVMLTPACSQLSAPSPRRGIELVFGLLETATKDLGSGAWLLALGRFLHVADFVEANGQSSNVWSLKPEPWPPLGPILRLCVSLEVVRSSGPQGRAGVACRGIVCLMVSRVLALFGGLGGWEGLHSDGRDANSCCRLAPRHFRKLLCVAARVAEIL